MPSGPYLPTSASYLRESSLLLQAYPDSTRIVTKYTYPKSSTHQTQQQSQDEPAKPPLATLVLKTYTAEAGICLKYRTNKAAEVGRLITALGLLAGGADLGTLDSGVAGVAGDEVTGVTATGTAAVTTGGGAGVAAASGTSSAGISKGKGKGKKKGKK
ncbi:signal recognition particle 9 kDa protein-domain-containing protein [Aspergillus spectabilis]